VAVGTADIVETVNTSVAVFNKASGAQLADYPFETFWTGATNVTCSDPRAIYIPGDNRFALSCVDIGSNQVMRMAISKSGDPTAGWYQYAVGPADDQPKIEATSDKIILVGNNSTNDDLYVFNKSDLLSGVASPAVVHLTTVQSNIYMATVEQTLTANGYLVDTYQCSGCHEWLATITGTPAASDVALNETDLGTTTDASPVEPSVPGGSIGGGDLDGRTLSAVYERETSDSKPVIQYSAMDECSSRVCIVSGRIDLSGATPVRTYENSIGAAGWDYTYGAAGLDAAGSVFDAYSRSNTSTAPGAAVIGPAFDLTLQPPVAGTTSCATSATPPCDERWGDYLGTALDPSDPTAVWVSGLYQATSGTYGWRTIFAKVSTNTTALPTVTSVAPSSGPLGGGTTITVTGSGFKSGTVADVGSVSLTPVGGGKVIYATTITVVSGTKLTAVVPDASSIAGNAVVTTDIRVTANGLESLVSTGDRFKFTLPHPVISSVVFTGNAMTPKVTLKGTGFGVKPTGTLPCGMKADGLDYGTSALRLEDTSNSFTAGQAGDCVGLVIASYSATSVVLTLGGYYKGHYSAFAKGDKYAVTIWGVTKSGTVAYA
jgi:hypothetical protein